MRTRAASFVATSLIALSIVSLPGCVDRILTVNSDPDGAIVYLNDQEVGRTPFTHDFQQYGNYELQVRKDGYETVKGTQVMQEPWWQLIPFDLITELLPWTYTDHRYYHYTLVEASTQPANAQDMLTRAQQMRSMLISSPNTRLPTSAPATQPSPTARKTKPPASAE